MERFAFTLRGKWLAPISLAFLLCAYHLLFGRFFLENGTIGHDFSRVLPDLLDGYFWFSSNGLLEPFWFTPAFCGGQPALGDLVSTYYSIPQFLAFHINPLTSVYASVLIFASVGFVGSYFLLRSCFTSSREAAVLAAALFMFNGFFIHRMIIGHVIYQGMMLIPAIAFFLLRPAAKSHLLVTTQHGAVVGTLVAYCAYSGLLTILLPCVAAVLAIACIHTLSGQESSVFIRRGLVAALIATGLSAAKITAAISFLHNFPRSDYSLPGIVSGWKELHVLFEILFLSPSDIVTRVTPVLAGMQWMIDRQEWEYGVTPIPLLLLLGGITAILTRFRNFRPQLGPAKVAAAMVLLSILALPLALNLYTPDWNAFLKQVPVIKSSSNLLRWFLLYIPILCLASALVFDRIPLLKSYRSTALFTLLAGLVIFNASADRSFYQAQTYRPDAVVRAWEASQASAARPRIEYIGAIVDPGNGLRMTENGNDMITKGGSQLACYNAAFGYRLEHLPFKTLHPGPLTDETEGRLNVKNPACYQYPRENSCAPGDHFAVTQRDAAEAFASYKPYPFQFSRIQRISNWLTVGSSVVLAALLVASLAMFIRQSFSSR